MFMDYFNPTRFIFGKGCVSSNAQLLASFGKKAFIVTGRRSAKENGSLADVKNALERNNVESVLFDRVMANPTVDCLKEGLASFRSSGADFIIGIGGGSAMDAAKAIGFLANNDVDFETIREKIEYRNPSVPVIEIPTTSGTGSEITQYALFMDEGKRSKFSISSPLLFPRLALLDPAYTMGLDKKETVNTAVDALSHCIEAILSKRCDPYTVAVGVEGIKAISAAIPAMLRWEMTCADRETLMYGSLMGGLVLAHCSTAVVHGMGYSITYDRGTAHGRANGYLLPGYMRLVSGTYPDAVKTILDAMRLESVEGFRQLMHTLLEDAEPLSEEKVEEYTGIALHKTKNINNSLVVPTEEDIKEIYRSI